MLKKTNLVLMTKKGGHAMIGKKGGIVHPKNATEKMFNNVYKPSSPLEK